MKPYSIAIAGSTQHTVLCAETLRKSGQFTVPWVLTPFPRPIGRAQTLTQNPLHRWSEAQGIPSILIEKKIDAEVKTQIEAQIAQSGSPDFLLVVDFGYLVPEWLLKLPTIAPLNIHPSLLPRWRGSSPGQFVLLYGDRNSAITLMQMDKGLDTGPVIYQEKFVVDPGWDQPEYYKKAFELICAVLEEKVVHFAQTGQKTEQPTVLPTPLARRLSKGDGFVPWAELFSNASATSNALFQEVMSFSKISLPSVIEHAARAFAPWPGVWTLIPTSKGEKRMQILSCQVQQGKLVLEDVKIEGQEKAKWAQVKNQILEK